jgi:glycosyltransferase involved in cell wall biosynthesis
MVAHLRVPSGVTWELLVVDNGSTDDTNRVIRSFGGRLPVRRLFEPEPGLSRARNLAVEHAGGDYIVWTDDDVLVDPGWLQAYCDAFARHPDGAFFGGPVEPWFEGESPAWLERAWVHVGGAYAVRDLGATEFTFDAGKLPFGANMAFRTDWQRRVPFDVDLGHNGDAMVGGEETDVMQAIFAAGGTGWWVPDALVQHFIPRERQRIEYLESYFFGRGQRYHLGSEAERWRWLGVSGWRLQRLVGGAAYRLGLALRRPGVWAWGLTRGQIARGYLCGYPRQSPGAARVGSDAGGRTVISETR